MQGGEKPLSVLSGAFAERIPDNVLLNPIDYIFADHCRQANLCKILKLFAARYFDAAPDLNIAATIQQYLDVDLNLHFADEEIDLIPHLRAHVLAEDRFSELLRLLDQEHDRDRILAKKSCAGFARITKGEALDDPDKFCHIITTFSAVHLSHLNWENVAILPLARKRLTDDDLSSMAHAMATRRSISFPDY